MKVTAWTNEEYARKHYVDVCNERLKLLNPNKKMITSKELTEMAKSKGISNEEMCQIWLDINDKIPNYVDEEKADVFCKIEKELIECVIKHCKEKGIRFSSDYHQYGDYSVPIIDDKYMVYTFARTWGRIMAEADDDFSEKGYLKYYLHGNEHPTKYPNEIKGEKIIKGE